VPGFPHLAIGGDGRQFALPQRDPVLTEGREIRLRLAGGLRRRPGILRRAMCHRGKPALAAATRQGGHQQGRRAPIFTRLLVRQPSGDI
jgi:hypothetical protein